MFQNDMIYTMKCVSETQHDSVTELSHIDLLNVSNLTVMARFKVNSFHDVRQTETGPLFPLSNLSPFL